MPLRTDKDGVTRFLHQCGAAFQFVIWVALWILAAAAVVG
jgi:hypothetical protein